MSELTLYIDYISQPSRAVLCFISICKIPCKVVEIRLFKGAHLTPAYKSISPSQTVPTLIHADLTLYESHAILIYLSTFSQIGPQWYPTDLVERAQVDCYLHWHHFYVRFGCGLYLSHKFGAPLIYGKNFPDIEAMDLYYRDEAFHLLENTLASGVYIGKTMRPTIADISCYCEVVSLKWVKFDYSKYPNLIRWMGEIGEIPEVKEVHSVYFKLIPKEKI